MQLIVKKKLHERGIWMPGMMICVSTKLKKRTKKKAWHYITLILLNKVLIQMFLHGASRLCTGTNNEYIFTINL